jgi:uncharacterized protein DUF4410
VKIFRPVGLFLTALSIALPNPSSKVPKPVLARHVMQDPNAPATGSKIVYVSDFELDVRRRSEKNSSRGAAVETAPEEASGAAPAAASASSNATPTSSSSKTSRSPASAKPADSQTDDTASERANALVTAMSEHLLRTLGKAGYTVHRFRPGEALPQAGLRIRGVFAEPDEGNRIRRLLVGSDSTALKMLLYVGVDDLARPEQPLYELAKPLINDGKHGPVITVTSYSPVARFEMDKNPSDEDIKKVVTDIVADLSALLHANHTWASQ